MRFKLTLSKTKEQEAAIIPVNYQYPVSAWIYKVINAGNNEFADWLHSKGYSDDKKQFRLFTFSHLQTDNAKVVNDRLIINSNTIVLNLSFYPIEAMEHFITGLFQNQQFTLGDKKSKAAFTVQTIERTPEPNFSQATKFKALSPICISHKSGQDQKYAKYKHPKDEDYGQLLINNLFNKYNTFYNIHDQNKCLNKELYHCQFQLLTDPKQKLITIKAGTPQESKLKGYLYQFSLYAQEELLRFGYYAGFGEKNSLGFGCGEVKCEV
jgi:CRISPR-associated endoribonuclease Cas6